MRFITLPTKESGLPNDNRRRFSIDRFLGGEKKTPPQLPPPSLFPPLTSTTLIQIIISISVILLSIIKNKRWKRQERGTFS
jgi:hypothetical protein